MLAPKALNHDKTPFELEQINQDIEGLLANEDTDSAALSNVIDKRHEIITEYLQALPTHERKSFIEAEIPINDYLNTFVSAMLKECGNVLFSFSKGRKAVDKYNQIK